jgi:prepilin-type N-terminal cleavage/methylation domain-containing protein
MVMPYNQSHQALTLLELVVALIIIGVCAYTFLGYLYQASLIAKEKALEIQLKSLRLALTLYQALEGHYPGDLEVFYLIFGEKYLAGVNIDKQGYPVDIFGNKFYYNAKLGEVRSGTRGYENW